MRTQFVQSTKMVLREDEKNAIATNIVAMAFLAPKTKRKPNLGLRFLFIQKRKLSDFGVLLILREIWFLIEYHIVECGLKIEH